MSWTDEDTGIQSPKFSSHLCGESLGSIEVIVRHET
jgi:hypothetical protein